MNEKIIGELAFVITSAAALAFPLSLFLLWLYRRAVAQTMKPDSLRPPTRLPAASATEHAPNSVRPLLEFKTLAANMFSGSKMIGDTLYSHATRRPWHAAAVYGAAGLLFALVMQVAEEISLKEFVPARFLFLFWSRAWPIVLTVNLVAASTRRTQVATTGAYFAIFLLLAAIGLAKSPDLTLVQLIILWSIDNLIPTPIFLAFLNRRIRAVGPLVFTVMTVAFCGATGGLHLFGSDTVLLQPVLQGGKLIGLSGSAAFFNIIVMSFVLFAVLGWLLAVWIGRGYQSKKISDQSIVLDSLWVFFAIYHAAHLAFDGKALFISGLASFFVYKVAVLGGFRLLHADRNGTPSNTRLLILRVFTLGKRSEPMFDVVTKHWRHIGSVQLIASTDLATTIVKPHEFLGFLSGKLARLFINGRAELDRRMADMDMNPDFDGRFRINDFFCRDDTWKLVLSKLVRESDVIMMDLRGFSSERKGCIFELNELVNVVPVQRVVLVVDEETKLPFLEQTIRQSWSAMASTSPNAIGSSKALRLFQINSREATPVSQLISELCASAAIPTDVIPNETTAILAGIGGAVQGKQFPVDKEIFYIGAAPDSNLIIKHDDYVSGHHACLRYGQGALSIVDQRSKNGTFVNDNRLRDAPLTVKPGDKIRMGKSMFEVAWIKSEDEKLRESKRA